jgi:hypothetical protein
VPEIAQFTDYPGMPEVRTGGLRADLRPAALASTEGARRRNAARFVKFRVRSSRAVIGRLEDAREMLDDRAGTRHMLD